VTGRDEASRRQCGGSQPFVTDLYQREIANAAELAQQVAGYLVTFNEMRPHESLGHEIPRAIQRGESHPFRG